MKKARQPFVKRKWVKTTTVMSVFALFLLGIALADKPLLTVGDSFSAVVTDREGGLLRLTLDDKENYRAYAPLKDISKNAIDATLLYEDRYFRYHFGVNLAALAEAMLDSYILEGRRRGASTITMQLARMRFQLETTSPWGKLVQIFYALKLEAHYTKDEILEAYLNLAPYGGNVIGIRAASLIYFGKEPRALSLAESMTLSVIPQNPERRKPTRQGMEPKALTEARGRLAEAWTKQHPEQSAEQMSLMHPLSMRTPQDLPFTAPHFTTEALLESPNVREIKTTLDGRLYQMLQLRIEDYVRRYAKEGITNAAAVLVKADTMEVLAAVGSADFLNKEIEGQVNALNAPRSPGSTLKPFVYALAMDQGLIHPDMVLKDAPSSFGEYAPQNFDGEFEGPLSAKEALIRSRNIPALALSAQLERQGLYGFLKSAGISHLKEEGAYGLAPVLGGVEVTMADLARLYAMLKNGGVMRPLITRLSGRSMVNRSVRLLSPEASFLTLKMLEANPRPHQKFEDTWVKDRVYVAWKTGTSPGSRDAWSVGATGPYVLVVWVGQFSGGRPIYVGIKSAAPLFFDIVDSLRSFADLGPLLPDKTLQLAKVPLCTVSGALPNEYCPHQKEGWFIPGKSPISKCTVHRSVRIDRLTGLRSCDANGKSDTTEVFEFWPSDLALQFEEAGLTRKSPPPYNKGCDIPLDAGTTSVLSITSPRNKVDYAMRASNAAKERIAFRAVTDADAEILYWFVDTSLVGTVKPRETVYWKPMPGEFSIRVVDDKGRTAERELKVTLVE